MLMIKLPMFYTQMMRLTDWKRCKGKSGIFLNHHVKTKKHIRNIDVTLGINDLRLLIMCKIIDEVKIDVRTKAYDVIYDREEMLNKINIKEELFDNFA